MNEGNMEGKVHEEKFLHALFLHFHSSRRQERGLGNIFPTSHIFLSFDYSKNTIVNDFDKKSFFLYQKLVYQSFPRSFLHFFYYLLFISVISPPLGNWPLRDNKHALMHFKNA